MRKSIYLFAAFSFLAVSCNKEGFEPMAHDPSVDPGRLTVVSGEALDGGLVPMNETFTLSGKGSSLSYTYKVFAESPIVNGNSTAATSTDGGGKFVFVSWHTEGFALGGAVSVYEFNGTEYSYVARIDFDDTDWHDLVVEEVIPNVEYNIYLAGQRNPDSSGYLLSTHFGAVTGKLTFNDNAAEKFLVSDYAEIPLESFGANGITLDAAGVNVLVATGNGTGAATPRGGVYQVDASNFEFVSSAYQSSDFNDGEYVAYQSGAIYALEREGNSKVEIHAGTTLGIMAPLGISATANVSSLDNERNAMVHYTVSAPGESGFLAALGTNGVYRWNGSNFTQVANIGSAALSVSHDMANQLVYVAAGGGGLHVLADYHYADGKALIDQFDLIGKFIPPSAAPFNSNFEVKDVTVYNNDQLSIASGNGGMFFVEQN